MDKCQEHSAHTEKLNHIERQLECVAQIAEKLTIVEQSTKTAHKRIDDVHAQTTAIVEMGTSIKMMAKQVQDMLEMLKNHNDRIECLERAPGDNLKSKWQDVSKALIACAVTLFLRYLITGGW